ncbi:MAG: hypothetical protein EPN94_07015 [Nitrospirae bacterium]|nr:MAG: hypothetical protein EPN94_07015 [Nitrospirota bacterium]
MAEALLKKLTKRVKGSKLLPASAGSPKANDTMILCHSDTKSWGAIKFTNTPIYCSITDTPEILAQENKDTARLLKAGAENVLWVQSPAEGLKEVLPLAVDRLSHLKGIIVEGNSAIEFLKPDVVIFIFGRDSGTLKKSAMKVLDMADIILFEEKPSVKLPVRPKKFKVAVPSASGLDECINYVHRLLR